MKFGRVKPEYFGVWHIMDGDSFLCGDDGEPNEFLELLGDNRVCKACRHAGAGYKVETVRAGQTRRYGPTINTYKVIDLKKRSKEEVFDYCRENIKFGYRRDEDGFHSLTSHVKQFIYHGNGEYGYEVGHEYTG